MKELTFTKVLALIVINCFLLTSVYGQSVAMVAENVRSTNQYKQIFEDFALPYSYGRINASNFTGSDTVVINIQDLHSHPEVQKNISNIISVFDKQYGVKNVYLEGAYGQVDTSWLSSIADKELKNRIVESMLQNGKLTGAEYYSVISNKNKIIRGLENKEEYLKNLKLFGEMLYSQNEVSALLDSLYEDLSDIKKVYFNRRQLKVDELSKDYHLGKIEPKKYYSLISKHTDKLGIDMYKYENIDAFIRTLEESKKINLKRATQELQMFVLKLKEILPYSAYKMIVDSTNNFSDLETLYTSLIRISRENNIDLSVTFPELDKFFNYIELKNKINPIEMLNEEQKLANEINQRFSINKSESEVVFLVSFHKYLKDYLSTKIIAEDYEYYKANIDEFKRLWVKYVDNTKLDLIEPYEKNADAFYNVNTNRNEYFVDNMDLQDISSSDIDFEGLSDITKTIKSLKSAKTIYVTVTGGFHTKGLSEILAKKGISYIIITPNVDDEGVTLAEETYHKIAKEQSKILFQALATLNPSLYSSSMKLLLALQSYAPQSEAECEMFNSVFQSMIGKGEYADITSISFGKNENGEFVFRFSGMDANRVLKNYEASRDKSGQWTDTSSSPDGSAPMTKKVSYFAVGGLVFIAAGAASALIFSNPLTAMFFAPFAISQFARYFKLSGWKGQKLAQISNIINEEDEVKQREMLSSLISQQGTIDTGYFNNLEGDERNKAMINEAKTVYRNLIINSDILKALEKNGLTVEDIIFEDVLDKAGTVAEYKDGKIYVNTALLVNGYKLDSNTRSLSTAAILGLRNIIFHEIRHRKIEEASNIFARFVHSFAWLEELYVGSADFFNYIGLALSQAKNSLLPKIIEQKGLSPEVNKIAKEALTAILAESGIPFDENRFGPQSNFAGSVADGFVTVLGTSGGKTLGAPIAALEVLARNAANGKSGNVILFSSKTETLIKESRDAFAQFLVFL